MYKSMHFSTCSVFNKSLLDWNSGMLYAQPVPQRCLQKQPLGMAGHGGAGGRRVGGEERAGGSCPARASILEQQESERSMAMDFLVPTDAPLQLAPIHPSAQESHGQDSSSRWPAGCLSGSLLVLGGVARTCSPVSVAPPGLPAAGTVVQASLQSGRGATPRPFQVTPCSTHGDWAHMSHSLDPHPCPSLNLSS